MNKQLMLLAGGGIVLIAGVADAYEFECKKTVSVSRYPATVRAYSLKMMIESYEDCRERAVGDGRKDDIIEKGLVVKNDTGYTRCYVRIQCVPSLEGRMSGGGGVLVASGSSGDTKATDSDDVTDVWVMHRFDLHCNVPDGPNYLQIDWGGNSFQLLELKEAICRDNLNLEPVPSATPFDTFTGFGVGRFNDGKGFVRFLFTDSGEPGTKDRARIVIFNEDLYPVLYSDSLLAFGNHQTHAQQRGSGLVASQVEK